METRNEDSKIPGTCNYIGCSYKLKNVTQGHLGKDKKEDREKKKQPGLELQEDRGRQGEVFVGHPIESRTRGGRQKGFACANGGENPGPDTSLDRYRNVSHHKQQRERPRQTPRSRGPGGTGLHVCIPRDV